MSTSFINLEGISMRPYLKSGELVEVKLGEKPNLGDLVYAKIKNSEKFLVHRFLGKDLIKGDRVKDYDQATWGELEVLGVVTGLEFKKSFISLNDIVFKLFHKFMAFLSKLNTREHPILSKFAVMILIILGHFLRAYQVVKYYVR